MRCMLCRYMQVGGIMRCRMCGYTLGINEMYLMQVYERGIMRCRM